MFYKRGQGLSITAIVVIILTLIVLFVAYLILAGPSNEFIDTIREQLGISTTLLEESKIK